MKIIAKILYAILALVILMCAFILLCAANPDIANTVSEIVKKNVPVKEETEEEATEDISIDLSSLDTSQEEKEEEPEEKHQDYNDYVDKRFPEGIVDPNSVQDYISPDEEDPYQKVVEEGTDDSLFDDSFFDMVKDKTDYTVTEPEVTDITDEEEANEIIDSTGVGETGENEEFDPLFYPYYHMLNDRGKRLYKQIYANSNALISEFKPVEDCTPSEFASAFDCCYNDHPELFWLDLQKYYEYDYTGRVIKIGIVFYKEIPDVEKAKGEFNAAAEEILTGAKDLPSDYEKEKYIHDLLADKITYEFNSLDQSAYSSIPNDFTVCAGYARAFQYLMQQLGVPTYFTVGWGGEMHAWDIIKLEDDYYNVDVTWDDQDPTMYEYFNVSDKQNLMHTRMYQSRYLPPCNGTKYSGLEKSEADLSGYDLASDEVFTDYRTYFETGESILDSDIAEGKTESEFNLIISKDIFMEWYSINAPSKTGGTDNELIFTGDAASISVTFEHLDDGNYLIRHKWQTNTSQP